MKKLLLLIPFLGMMLYLASCGTHRAEAYYDFDSKVIANSLDGNYTLRVWGRGRNAARAYQNARRTAVYDVMFKDIQIQSGTNTQATSVLRPLITELNAQEKYADYVNALFGNDKEFEKYCSIKTKRTVTTNYSRTDAQTVAQVTVLVNRQKLKDKLIQDGIIKK